MRENETIFERNGEGLVMEYMKMKRAVLTCEESGK